MNSANKFSFNGAIFEMIVGPSRPFYFLEFMKNLISLLLLLSGSATAQTVTNADNVGLQPLITRDAGGFKSCGVRVVTMVTLGTKVESYDISVNAQIEPLGTLIKAGKYNVTLHPGKTPNFVSSVARPPPSGFWIAAADQAVPLTMGHASVSDTPGFTIGVGDFIEGIKVVLKVVNGAQMQFVVQGRERNAVERIVSFAKPMDEPDMATLNSCLQGLMARMTALAEKSKE